MTHPGALAALDQVSTAYREAELAADPRITEAFTAWLHETLIACGRAYGCPHHWTPQVLTVLRIMRTSMLCCDPCHARVIGMVGPSQTWKCGRCEREASRADQHPTFITAAIGPVLMHVDLCVYCAFDLGIDYNHPQQEGSP